MRDSDEAKRVVEIAVRDAVENRRQYLWLSGYGDLKELPSEIAQATHLRKLSLWGTGISDLSALSGLTSLRTLELWRTPVEDISPLAGLMELEALDLTATGVTSLTPLANLKSLRYLDASRTKIGDLEHLRNCRRMRKLRVSGTRITNIDALEELQLIEGLDISTTAVGDLSPLKGHRHLAALNIAHTQVTDLSPLAECEALATDLRTRIGGPMTSVDVGINFRGAPISDPHILTFRGLRRERTTAILNYLRFQVGLPRLGPVAETRGFDFSQLPERLPQTSFGAVFEPSDEVLRMAPSGSETDLDAAQAPITQQLHTAAQRKLAQLKDSAGRLANQRGWEDFSPCVNRLSGTLARSTIDAASEIGSLWAESVTLGSFLDQDDRITASPDGFVEPLSPDLRRALQDVIETLGPWLRRFPTARELDEDGAAHREGESDVALAIEILADAETSSSISPTDAALIAAALNASARSEKQGKKAGIWGLASVRNITFAAISVVALGFGTHVGTSIAERSVLSGRIQEFVLKSEARLLEFLKHLPSDIRAAVTSLLKQLKGGKA